MGFEYLIVSSFAFFFYWSMRVKHDHAAAVAIINILKIIGIGALVVTIAGDVADDAVGVVLGGFMSIVISFASSGYWGILLQDYSYW